MERKDKETMKREAKKKGNNRETAAFRTDFQAGSLQQRFLRKGNSQVKTNKALEEPEVSALNGYPILSDQLQKVYIEVTHTHTCS